MTLQFVCNGVDLGTTAVRLGKLTGFTAVAEEYTVGSCIIPIDDITGTTFAGIVGLKDFHVNETACTPARLWSGYVDQREFFRGDSLVVGTAHQEGVSLVDLNTVLSVVVISGSDGNRPAETDIARINWLLGSSYMATVHDNGYIDTTGPVSMDATDYRGQYPRDVLAQCSDLSGKNGCLIYHDANGQTSLFYMLPTQTAYASTLKLSTVLADVDGSTVFAPRMTPHLTRDPSRVYSGIYLSYANGAVYVTNPATEAAFNTREIAVSPNRQISTSTTATAYANKYLVDAASEDDRISCIVQLPADKVNLIREAMALPVKFPQLPGYSAYTYVQVVRRTVAQDEDTDQLYNVSLELSNIKLMGLSGGGTPGPGPVTPPPNPNPPTPASPSALVVGGTIAIVNSHDGFYPPFGSWIPNHFGNAINHVVASGCGVGTAFWYGPPEDHTEEYHVTGSLVPPAGAVGARLTYETYLAMDAVNIITGDPNRGGGYKVALWLGTVPLGTDGGIVLFSGDAPLTPITTTVNIDVPVNLIANASPLPYVTWSRGVPTAAGTGCQANSANFPYTSGLGMSYQYHLAAVSLAWLTLPTGFSGPSGWVPSISGDVDGLNATFTLGGWIGIGEVRATVNGLDYAVVSQDGTAKTVTLEGAPPPYAVVLFDYTLST